MGAAVSTLRAELAAATANGAGAGLPGVQLALRGLAREIVAASRPNRRDSWVQDALGFVKTATGVGAHDLPADADDVAFAGKCVREGWTGLLAAMLLAPSSQVAATPSLEEVPDWLWADYVGWLCAVPPRFSHAGSDYDAEKNAKRLRDLERLVSRNAGSSSIRAAIDGYLQAAGVTFAQGDAVTWHAQAESRGKILTRARVRGRDGFDPVVSPRHGRRLRVGFVARDFGPCPAVFSALAGFEQLDPKGFDVFLFPFAKSDSPEAAYCARRARALEVLPEGTQMRVSALRNAQLDVLIFVGDLATEWNELTELALYRVVPLQVANHRSGYATGLPEIDLNVSARETSMSAGFSERLGIVRGPAFSIAFGQADAAAAPVLASREEVGLPVDRTVFVSVVDWAGTEHVRLEEWAALLAKNSQTHLAIAFAYEGEASQLTRFCAAVDRALAMQGVEQTRVTIFPTSASRPHEARALISLGDIYLDAGVGATGSWAAAEALRAGVPLIAIRNESDHVPAYLLESVGLPELAVADVAAYATAAGELAGDPNRRTALRERIRAAMEASPVFMDTLAASDAFGALIEAAFDELASLGRSEFRRQSEPIRCFGLDTVVESVEAGLAAHARGDIESAAMEANLALRSAPGDTRVRHLQGLVLHAQGNTSRAVDYLLAAVQGPDATAAMWYSLAIALRDNRQPGEAIQVLETCIRLDNRNVEALFMLLELAEAAGATEIARDVLECLKEIAPEDARVLALS